MKKKRLVLALTAIMAVLSLGLVGCGEEKRGEEVSAEQWKAAFANLNTEYITVEEIDIFETKQGAIGEISTIKYYTPTEMFGISRRPAQLDISTWEAGDMQILEEKHWEKVANDQIFVYSTSDKGILPDEKIWKLKQKEDGKKLFEALKEFPFRMKQFYFNVYCEGVDVFTYYKEQGAYYKEWTDIVYEKEIQVWQTAIFQKGELYKIVTKTKCDVAPEPELARWEMTIKITFEAEEIVLPDENELNYLIENSKEE